MKKSYREPQIEEADVRALARMISEATALDVSVVEKRRHLMNSICRYLKADAWAWGHAAEMTPGKLPVYVAMLSGGFSEEQWASFLTVQTHPQMARISAPVALELAEKKRHLTRSLPSLVPIPEFLKMEVAELWQRSGVYPLFISFYPLPNGIHSGIALYRKCGGPWATEREIRLGHILMSEVPWLHQHDSTDAVMTDVPRLALRQRLVLELLLNGHSRKFIAGHMKISINTVAGYVRDIYRFFNVTSQPQLVRRFFRGDGGDVG
jgi:DNA-binding CsgD family transcriptional regulator